MKNLNSSDLYDLLISMVLTFPPWPALSNRCNLGKIWAKPALVRQQGDTAAENHHLDSDADASVPSFYHTCIQPHSTASPSYFLWISDRIPSKFFSMHIQFSSVQSLSRVQLFATPWITAPQAFLSITNSRSSLRLTSIESVMPSSHLILCRPLLLLPPIPPSIRVFSSESTLLMRWPKY